MNKMHKYCLCCGKKFSRADLINSWALKCLRAYDWRMVAIKVYPKTEGAIDIVDGFVITSSHHEIFLECKPDIYIARINFINEEGVMEYEPINGSLFHKSEIMCGKCVAKMRRKKYNGGEDVPEIRCPICETILVLY